MGKITRFALSLTAAALMWTGCETQEPEQKPDQEPDQEQEQLPTSLPSITISDVTINETQDMASVTVTPSENADAWYWKVSVADAAVEEYTKEEGGAKTLEIPFEAGVKYLLTAYPENKLGAGLERTKEWVFTKEELQAEFIELSIKNVSPYSMDVEISKNAECSKYVVLGIPTASLVNDGTSTPYTEEEIDAFITDFAVRSLNPETNENIQPYHVAEASASFTERTLSKDGLIINPEKEYMVAVYAVNESGLVKIYKDKATTPAVAVTGSVETKVEVVEGMVDFTVTATGDDKCSRMIVGFFAADDPLFGNSGKFSGVAEADRAAALASLAAQQIPTEYTGSPISRKYDGHIVADKAYVAYAVAIDKEGKLGKVAYKEFSTQEVDLTKGKGKFESVEFFEQHSTGQANGDYTIHLIPMFVKTQDAVAVRIYSSTRSNYDSDKSAIPEDMICSPSRYGLYTEYSANDLNGYLTLTVDIPGQEYAVFGTTVDAEGNVSELVNLVSLATNGEAEFLKTLTEEELENAENGGTPGEGGDIPGEGGDNPGEGGDNPGEGGDNPGEGGDNPGEGGDNPGEGGETPADGLFSGIGEATFQINSLQTVAQSDWGKVRYEVIKGENTVKAYIVKETYNDDLTALKTTEELKASVEAAFAAYPEELGQGVLTIKDVKAENDNQHTVFEFNSEILQEFGSDYGVDYSADYGKPSPLYGGTLMILVTVDTNGKLKICQIYESGAAAAKDFE